MQRVLGARGEQIVTDHDVLRNRTKRTSNGQ